MNAKQTDEYWMNKAIDLAWSGRGLVEPNPMVGCVIVDGEERIASGFHRKFGGPHAEIEAITVCPKDRLATSTVYVTLEPCSHFGKTPPCADFLIQHRPKRIVVAMSDPFPAVAGDGIRRLREAGIAVEVGICEQAARDLNAPYLKRLSTGKPWTIAKWAMTLDGAIATSSLDSKWISGDASRQRVHELRSRVDAVIVGIGTALADDPMLNTRLPFDAIPHRVAKRVVMDREARLPVDSRLVQSAAQLPLLVVVSEAAPESRIQALTQHGCSVLAVPDSHRHRSLEFLLETLGNDRATNVLIEGGGTLLGHAFDERLIDEVHCFIAPKLVGGQKAARPIQGQGVSTMAEALGMKRSRWECVGDDLYFEGIIDHNRTLTRSG